MNAYTGSDNLEVMACAVNYNRFLDRLVRRELRADMRALDFGAGIGTFAKGLVDAGYRVACVEPDRDQADVLEQRGLENARSLQDYPSASFDFAFSLNVLEHIHADVEVLRLLRTRLRTGARLLVYVPALRFLYSAMDEKVGHVRRYSARSLQASLRQAGFTVERCRYADCLGIPATLAYKLVGASEGKVNERALVAYDRIAFPVSRLLDSAMQFVAGKNVWALAVNVG